MPVVARSSQLFVPTLKETPVDAVAPSHQLLVRAGFVRQLGAGLYSFLPLGWRSLRKLEGIVRQEMQAASGQEFLLPSLHPAELWRQSGRWDEIDQTMFRLRDRRGGDYCLAMTHEEVFTGLARAELRSYRQLPQVWYQIGPKFRDEPRPRSGLLRVREFLMKDAYSFDLDAAGLDRSFARMRAAYERIYARCGLEALPAEAFAGVKFKDADLVGIPLRLAVGRRGLAQRQVEWKRRGEPQVELVPIGDLAERARAVLAEAT